MKVYVITCGEYSCYEICAVTLDKKQAELLKVRYSNESDEACIEEFDTDNYKIEVSENYKPMWNVVFWPRNGAIISCYKISHDNVRHGEIYAHKWCYEVKVFVEAEDEEHAKKIATDIYMKWLAEQNNL